MKLSLGIITLNEENNLARCLESCQGVVDEIVILDSGSSDGTEAIARRYNALWHVEPWPGFVAQKNRLLQIMNSEWVLCLDADEALSKELKQEIVGLKTSLTESTAAGYSMPRVVCYEGRWIRHGDWYPDRLVRLFKRSQGRFAGGKVHERLEITGQIIPLQSELEHYSFTGLQDHWQRCQTYARLWAESARDAGKRAKPWHPHTHALFRFIRGFVLRRGFLDGTLGLRIALLSAAEVYLKYKLLRDIQDYQKK